MSFTPSVTNGSLELGDPEVIVELHDVLRAAGFTGGGVRDALGSGSEILFRSVDIPLHERRLDGIEPLGTLIKQLVLDRAVGVNKTMRAFAPLGFDRLERLGVLEARGGEVCSTVRIVPHDDLLTSGSSTTFRSH